MILLNLFPKKNRDTDIENRHVDTKGEGVTKWEIKVDIYTLPSMVFPVIMYGCESWTMKKAEL